MTKVLILDPFHKVDDLSEFKALAHLHCEWDFTRLSFEMSQSSPRDYLRVVLLAVEKAEIILCFGNFFWFGFCEGAGTEFADLLEHKLSSGTPFFLQLVRAADKLRSGLFGESFGQFLRRLNVIPTHNKIFSQLDAHPDHESGTSCWFKKEDGCFINPVSAR